MSGGKAAEQRRADQALVGGDGNYATMYATMGGAQQRTSSSSFDPARLFSVIRQRSRGVQDLAALLSSGSSNADRPGLAQALPDPNLRQACSLALELGRKEMLSLLLDTYGLPSTRHREAPSSGIFQGEGGRPPPSSSSPPPSQSSSPLSPISSAPAPAPSPAVAREEQHLLTRALQKGDAAMVQLLVGYVEGQDPDVHVPELPNGALAFACYLGNEKVVAMLLRLGADPGRVLRMRRSRTAFALPPGCLRLLLQAERVDVLHKMRILLDQERKEKKKNASTGATIATTTTSPRPSICRRLCQALTSSFLRPRIRSLSPASSPPRWWSLSHSPPSVELLQVFPGDDNEEGEGQTTTSSNKDEPNPPPTLPLLAQPATQKTQATLHYLLFAMPPEGFQAFLDMHP